MLISYTISTPCNSKLTDLDALGIANVGERSHGGVGVVAADLSNLGLEVLGLADALHVDGAAELAGGAKETGWRRSDREFSKREESRGKYSTSEHF